MPSKELAIHLFAFITSNNYGDYHRRRELEALTSKIEAAGGSVTVFEKPKFILSWLWEKFKTNKPRCVKESKPLLTFGSIQYLIDHPMLFKLLIALPIQIQISLRKKNRLHALALIYKPDQARYFQSKLPYIYIQYDNYSKDSGYFLAQNPSFETINQEVIKKSVISMFSSRALLEELSGNLIDDKCFHYPNAIDRNWLGYYEPKLSTKKQNIIGFVGQIDCSFDELLVEKIARAYPKSTLRIVGSIKNEHALENLKNLSNVEFLGKVSHSELPTILQDFDIGICPYKQDDFSKYRNPLKVYEYFSVGLPIVTMPCDLPKDAIELLYYAENHEQFLSLIKFACSEQDYAKKTQRISYSSSNCWDNRAVFLIEKVSPHILN